MSGTSEGNVLVAVTLLGWFPVVIALFTFLTPRRAVMAGFFIAWMFLPVAEIQFKALPELDKMAVTSISVLIGVIIFDTTRLINMRPRWYDLPIVAFCLVPFASSISNNLGAYDGASESVRLVLRWGIPYLIGRMYFSSLQGLRDLALGLFIAGLVYIPFCLYEIRMSPQLHRIVYGYHQHSVAQHFRFGGWRPKVFMEHGLMVGMFMTTAALSGFWLWKSGVLKRVYGLPPAVFVFPLLIMALLTRSTGAVILLFAGLGVLYAVHISRSSVPLLALCLLPMAYVGFRIAGGATGDTLVNLTGRVLGAERAQSLETRVDNEAALSRHALERPAFGWGGWNRARIQDESGRDTSITDSLWIIVFGMHGAVGLLLVGLTLVLPTLLLTQRLPAHFWGTAPYAAPAVLGVLLGLWIVDSTLNAMVTPVFIIALGGMSGLKKAAPIPARKPVPLPDREAVGPLPSEQSAPA